MAASSEEKTEQPTPKRLKELRKKNTVLRSPELNSSVGLIVLIVVAGMVIAGMWDAGLSTMRLSLASAGQLDTAEALLLMGEVFTEFFYAVALPVGVVLLAVIIAGLVLTRGRPNPYAIKPRADLLNPKYGVKRVLGVQGLVEAGKGLVKLIAVIAVSWGVLAAAYSSFLEGPASIGDFLAELGGYAQALGWRIAAVAAAIAAFDVWWNRRRYLKQARMTKSELKQEYRSSEGDPLIKQARRQRAITLARNRMMADVPTATVVLTNPTHLAIALRYSPGDRAPVVVARGAGVIAARIRKVASEAGVPVREDKPLARSLYRACRVGDAIPVELYEAVAAVLAQVMKIKRRRRRS